MTVATYDTKCVKCMEGLIHPFHDSGEKVEQPDGTPLVVSYARMDPQPRKQIARVVGCRCGCHAS